MCMVRYIISAAPSISRRAFEFLILFFVCIMQYIGIIEIR